MKGEKVVDWDSVVLNVTGLQVEEVEREEICSEIGLATSTLYFWDISERFNVTCSKYDLGFFYSGYTDREQHGRWRDVNTGQEMSWDNWLED